MKIHGIVEVMSRAQRNNECEVSGKRTESERRTVHYEVEESIYTR
jgi:hypothetical protein